MTCWRFAVFFLPNRSNTSSGIIHSTSTAMLDNASPAGIRVNTIVLAFTLVAGTVVFLRLFTRLVLTKGAGFEDVCIAFAMVCSSS